MIGRWLQLDPREAYPSLLALAYALVYALQVKGFVSYVMIFSIVAVILACVLALQWFLLLRFRHTGKSALVAFLSLGLVLYYGEFDHLVRSLVVETWWEWLARGRVLLPLTLASFSLAVVGIVRSKRDFKDIGLALTASTLAWVLTLGIRIAGENGKAPAPPVPAAAVAKMGTATRSRPDIFYIILDAYTSHESLRTYWQFDNMPFIRALENRGFRVLNHARSNYASTPYSIASALNMGYVPVSARRLTLRSLLQLQDQIRTSVVPRVMGTLGYEVVNLSLFDLGLQPALHGFPGFPRALSWDAVSTGSLPWYIGQHFQERESIEAANQEVIEKLKGLALANDAPGAQPRFVYAHLLMPHDPYLRRRDGSRRRDRRPATDMGAYLEQLEYTSGVALELVDALLKRPGPQPIVVLQGDHGFRYLRGPARIQERHTILNALLLPKDCAEILPPDLTPVNTFRLVLRYCFGFELALLPNHIHQSKVGATWKDLFHTTD